MRKYLLLFFASIPPLCTQAQSEAAQAYIKQNMQVIAQAPDVRLYHNFISDDEARHLINLGAGKMTRSSVTSEDGLSSQTHEARTSSTAYLERSEDAIVQGIEERVADLLQVPLENIEPLQIVHYNKDQQYKPHYDYFPENHVEAYNGAQRVHTLLIYLNDLPIEAGGETVFPIVHIGVKPVKRSALYFRDMKETGEMDTLTLHGGGPIHEEGYAKWACNVWVRNMPFEPLPKKDA